MGDKDWESDYDADTLQRAAEITSDKARFSRAQNKLKERQKALDKVLTPTKKMKNGKQSSIVSEQRKIFGR